MEDPISQSVGSKVARCTTPEGSCSVEPVNWSGKAASCHCGGTSHNAVPVFSFSGEASGCIIKFAIWAHVLDVWQFGCVCMNKSCAQ